MKTKDYVIKTMINENNVVRNVILVIDDDESKGSVYVELQGKNKGKYIKAIDFNENDNVLDLPEIVFNVVKTEDEELAGLLFEKHNIV